MAQLLALRIQRSIICGILILICSTAILGGNNAEQTSASNQNQYSNQSVQSASPRQDYRQNYSIPSSPTQATSPVSDGLKETTNIVSPKNSGKPGENVPSLVSSESTTALPGAKENGIENIIKSTMGYFLPKDGKRMTTLDPWQKFTDSMKTTVTNTKLGVNRPDSERDNVNTTQTSAAVTHTRNSNPEKTGTMDPNGDPNNKSSMLDVRGGSSKVSQKIDGHIGKNIMDISSTVNGFQASAELSARHETQHEIHQQLDKGNSKIQESVSSENMSGSSKQIEESKVDSQVGEQGSVYQTQQKLKSQDKYVLGERVWVNTSKIGDNMMDIKNVEQSEGKHRDVHNVVHSALTSDYDGEQVYQEYGFISQGIIETSSAGLQSELKEDVTVESKRLLDNEEMGSVTDTVKGVLSDVIKGVTHVPIVMAGEVNTAPKTKTKPPHMTATISTRIKQAESNEERTYFLAEPSQHDNVEMDEEKSNQVGSDDDNEVEDEEYDYDDYDYYNDYYYDDDEDSNYSEEDDDDEYADLETHEDDDSDEFGSDDDIDYDYYYDFTESDDDEDDDSVDDGEVDDSEGGTYEPQGVMNDAEWIMREGRLGAREYSIGQELHDFDRDLGPVSGSESELRHVPFEYEPAYHGNNMSLLVFYTWIGVVAFMVVVVLIALKNRQKISSLFWEKKVGYRRDRNRLVSEEGHTLLSHQHV